MATTDRYVFARVCPEHPDSPTCVSTVPLAVPAPSPEDWQAIVDAVSVYLSGEYADTARVEWAIATVAIAAVRNMREAQQ